MRGGIDLGGTKIQAVVVDDAHQAVGDARGPTPHEGGPLAVADAMAAVMRQAAEAADIDTAELAGVGVGAPGVVDARAGTVSSALNLPDWNGPFALAGALSGSLVTRVALGNDVQVATDGEYALGAGRGYRSVLGVFWGTGVGGGIVLDGKPWLGRGAAGEIGHTVVKMDGAKCPCGRHGCLEAYAGRAAMEHRARELHHKGKKTKLFKLMRERGRDRLTSGVWERALDHDDRVAVHMVDRAVEALAVGMASAANLLDVQAIILGGGMGVRLGERYLERIREEMAPRVFADPPPDLLVAQLGDLGGAVGASLLVA